MKQAEKFSFTENIDYLETGKSSIWGEGDKDTLDLLERLPIKGKWLNLAAGDGRYDALLLEKAGEVTATDIDETALDKLSRNTPDDLRKKLKTKTFNLTAPFPFEDNSFAGVFCTGTLHFFPKDQLENIFREINRILKPGGLLAIDFATDVKRVIPNGTLSTKENEAQYTQEEAKELLKSLLPNYKLEIIESSVPEEEIKVGKSTYNFSCNFLLISGEKTSD